MLYSHDQENEKLKQFAIFLDHAVKGNAKYASVVNDVILETHQYVAGSKTVYNITRDLMHIILLLSDTDKNYFEELKGNPEQYDKETYSRVLEMIDRPLKSEVQ